MRIQATVITVVVSALLWNSSVGAQGRHVVDPAVMQQAIADQSVTDQQNRDAVLGLLHKSEVRDVAGRLGLSVTSAEGAVSTLDSAELAGLAGQARVADAQLAGGDQMVVISITTLLLVLIIVILLVH